MPTIKRSSTSPDQFEFQPLGRSTLLNKIYVGFVKDAKDDQHMGRIRVWIPELGGDPNLETSWIRVSYASPFAGATDVFANTNGTNYLDSQRSYGLWFTPPDLNNEVLCCFINGDVGRGVWFACLYQQNMNHMVPGLPGNNSSAGLPVGEYNKLKKDIKPDNPDRPEYTPLAEAIRTQGLDSDSVRGITNSGARRENPSSVYGLLTPGGSQMVFDDSPTNKFIRFRTQNGAQILISDTTGEIYMITDKGNNWFSMSSDGAVSVYASGDINLRSEQSVNIRADLDVNLEAGRNMYVKVRGESETDKATDGSGQLLINAKAAIHVTCEGEYFQTSGGNAHRMSQQSIYDYCSQDGNYKAAANMHLQADGGDVNVKAKAEVHATATNIHFNGPPAIDAGAAQAGKAPTDFTVVDNENNSGTYKKTTRSTILYNLPYHEPYEHDSSVKTGVYNNQIEKTKPESDPNVRLIRDGEIVPNQERPTNIVGSPRNGMEPNFYAGIKYENGEPVYEKTGDTTTLTGLNPASSYSTSEDGLTWLRKKEGLRFRYYPDPPGSGKYSIGYGHQLTQNEFAGRYVLINKERVSIDQAITKEQAESLFRQDVKTRGEDIVKKGVTASITQSQFDALVSFAYNTGHMSGTDLAKAINEGNFQAVPKGFMSWIKAGGKVNQALIVRRRQESAWFLTGTRPPI